MSMAEPTNTELNALIAKQIMHWHVAEVDRGAVGLIRIARANMVYVYVDAKGNIQFHPSSWKPATDLYQTHMALEQFLDGAQYAVREITKSGDQWHVTTESYWNTHGIGDADTFQRAMCLAMIDVLSKGSYCEPI